MNPYEANPKIEPIVDKVRMFRQSRFAFYAAAAATALLMPLSAIQIAKFINETYQPNMGTWVLPFYFIVLVLCVPMGLLSAIIARWLRRFVSHSPLLPLSISIASGFLPLMMIPNLKGTNISSFWLQSGLLLFWTSGVPIFLGNTLYYIIRFNHPKLDDGQWPAPNYWNE